ncbi:MAG TPA: serine hydrolase [Mucilaginibacter sp.]|jgi:CubicO group peptidase (beta-lactamase class C family)|nr:serine hydrolase [Mucilaginibacter sp.]
MAKATCVFFVFVLASFVLISCHRHYRSAAYSYVKPKQLSDGLPVDAMYDNGMDTGKIVALTKLILADKYPNIHSMLILRHGKLIFENYFAGEDVDDAMPVGYVNHTIDGLHDCRSISKSFTSACIGIAIKQGFIKSIDEPIFPYFPEYAKYFDAAKRKITIRNLLTMTSGLQFDETDYSDPKNSYFQMRASDDPIKYVLSCKLTSAPGTVWNYSSGNTQLLGEIIWKATGERLDKYAGRNLFAPLGISKYDWRHMPNKKNMPAAAWGLRLRSRDLAKFGLLYMNNGKWGDTQILDSAWVKQSLSAQVPRPSESPNVPRGYGFQFWTDLLIQHQYKTDIPWATGYGGQLIFFWRSMDILVVFTGWNDNPNDPNAIVAFYVNIVPSVKEMQPYFK